MSCVWSRVKFKHMKMQRKKIAKKVKVADAKLLYASVINWFSYKLVNRSRKQRSTVTNTLAHTQRQPRICTINNIFMYFFDALA